MKLEYAVLIAGAMIALATWDKGSNARRSVLCDRLVSKLPMEVLVQHSSHQTSTYQRDTARSLVMGVEEQVGISLEECRK